MTSKKTICNLIVIDASGSMWDKEAEVKRSLKGLFKRIKEDSEKLKNIQISTIVCDFSGFGDFDVLINSSDHNELSEEIAENYIVRGLTALYDAIGQSFALVKEDYDQVLVNIITDGDENDSREYDFEKVKSLIQEKRKASWAISFMGTSEDSIQSAINIGISLKNARIWEDNGNGFKKTMAAYQESVSNIFQSMSAREVINPDDFLLKAV